MLVKAKNLLTVEMRGFKRLLDEKGEIKSEMLSGMIL